MESLVLSRGLRLDTQMIRVISEICIQTLLRREEHEETPPRVTKRLRAEILQATLKR